MTPHAPQVPPSWHAPAWVTPQSITLIVVGAAVLLVIVRLARAVGHLAKAATKAAAPVAAPASAAMSSRVPARLLVAIVAAVGGFVFLRAHNAAPAVKAAPAPSPTPRPTITQTVAPHVTAFHFPLTGVQILWALGIAAVVAIVLLGPVLRRREPCATSAVT